MKKYTPGLRKLDNGIVVHTDCRKTGKNFLLSPYDTTNGMAQCDACLKQFSALKYENAEKY